MGLAWHDVAAPDFSSSMRGYETFSNLLSQAFSGAQSTLGRYDADLDKNANNRILMQFAGIQDPEAAKAALAKLSTDPQASRFSAPTINALTGRPDALIHTAAEEADLAKARDVLKWSEADRGADMATAPLMMSYYAAKSKGGEALGQFLAAHPDFGNGLNIEKTGSLISGAQGYARGDRDIWAADQNYDQQKVRFGWDQETYNNNKDLQQWQSDLTANTATQEDAFRYLNSNKGKMTPSTYNLLYERVSGAGGGGAAGGATGGGGDPIFPGGGTPSGDPARIVTQGGAGNLGIKSVPDTVQNFGQAVQFGNSLINRGQASSAMGLYQITKSTMEEFGEKALGKDWQSQAFTAENQDKIAEQIFNDARSKGPGALRGRWTSINSDAQARMILSKPWAEARRYIAAGESGVDPATLAVRDAVIGTGAQTANMSRNADNITSSFAKSSQDTSDTPTVAARLLALPQFKGMDLGQITGKIDEIKAQAAGRNKTINSAVAADILQRSMSDGGWWGRRLPLGLGGNETTVGLYADPKKIDQYIRGYSSGDVERTVAGNASAQGNLQQLELAKTNYQRAYMTYQARIAAQRQGKNVDVAGAAADLAAASSTYAGLQNGMNDGNTTRFNTDGAPATRAATPKPLAAPVRAQVAGPTIATNNPPSSQKTFNNTEIFSAYAQGARLGVGHIKGESAIDYARRVFHYQEDLARMQSRRAFMGAKGNGSMLLRPSSQSIPGWPAR